ncbi:MAG: NADH-quinone oxidoreductase subunit C [Pseudomonadota bacterium]
MKPAEVYKLLIDRFGEDLILTYVETRNPYIKINSDHIQTICTFLRYNPNTNFVFLSSIAGVDYPQRNEIDIVYHLFSPLLNNLCVLKTSVPRGLPELESLESVWKVANWFEREIYDLLGVRFIGHSNLKRILLPDDWEGYPLRKDYKEKNAYHDMETTRQDPLKVLRKKNE